MSYLAAPGRYQDAQYRRAGRSGLLLPRISLGLWQNFGTDRPIDTQRAVVRRAFDLGVTHFDLANNYGPPYGAAETAFGRIFAEDLRAHRDEILVSSKAGYDMWAGPYGDGGSRKYMLASLDQSLKRLGLDYVDVFYSHRPDPETPLEETMGALATAVTSGRALYVGVSNYSPEQTVEAHRILASLGVPLVLHQPRYSLFDRLPEGGLFSALEDTRVGSIVFSPLAQGLLTGKYLGGTVPADSRASSSRYLDSTAITDDYLRRIRGLDAIATDLGLPVARLALAWVLQQQAVTSAIVGASSVAQLDQNLAALDVPAFDTATLARIDEFAAAPGTAL